jgi:hypothetical protein
MLKLLTSADPKPTDASAERLDRLVQSIVAGRQLEHLPIRDQDQLRLRGILLELVTHPIGLARGCD